MYLIEQAREIPQLLRNWQSFKLTKFVVVVVWCQFHFPFPPKNKTNKKKEPWSTIFLSPWYQTILAWGLASLALQLICLSVPAFTAIPESVLISSSLEGGTENKKCLVQLETPMITFEVEMMVSGVVTPRSLASYCCCAITRALWQQQQQQFRMHLHNSGSY